MELLEDRPCKHCKEIYTPVVEWQKFCPKKKDEESCHDKHWKEVYREKSAIKKRLDRIEKELGIKQ